MTDSQPELEFDLFISYVRRDVRHVVGGRSFDIVVELSVSWRSIADLPECRAIKGVFGFAQTSMISTWMVRSTA